MRSDTRAGSSSTRRCPAPDTTNGSSPSLVRHGSWSLLTGKNTSCSPTATRTWRPFQLVRVSSGSGPGAPVVRQARATRVIHSTRSSAGACAGPDMYPSSRLAPALLRRTSHGKVDRSISMDGRTCVRPAGASRARPSTLSGFGRQGHRSAAGVAGEHDAFTFVPPSDPGDQICQPGGIAGQFVIGAYRRAQTRLTGQVCGVDPTSRGERAEHHRAARCVEVRAGQIDADAVPGPGGDDMSLPVGGVDLVCCVRDPPPRQASGAPVTHLIGTGGRAVRACHGIQCEPSRGRSGGAFASADRGQWQRVGPTRLEHVH